MVKQTIEGLSILPSPPQIEGRLKEPVIRLADGLVLDDNILELATLLEAPPGGGKSVLLSQIIKQVLPHVASRKANAFLLDVKGELWKQFGSFPGAIRISPSEADDPKSCWNIFRELEVGKNAEVVARDISRLLLRDQRSEMQPFLPKVLTISL